jgi:TonB-linked SusC/RagA family outer membrane protein
MKKKIILLMSIIMYTLMSTSVFAQEKTVTGKVNDPSGQPLPGVTVLVKGTKKAVSTDFDGKYSVSVSTGGTLVFSYIGFKTKEQKVGNSNTYTISLDAENETLNEVVVVGYGAQKKKLTTGAMSSIKTESFTERPISTLDQGLVGQIAGVRVKQTTGLPGQPFSVEIRGAGSISAGNEPLYVVDGFPIHTEGGNSAGGFSNGSPLDNMNPNDVASIEVLKDAAAAAIYGSRASNGVVLITTKRGKAGKAKFTFNTYSGISKEANRVDVLDAEQWIARQKSFIDYEWVNSGIPGATANQTIDERIATYNIKYPTTPLLRGNTSATYIKYIYDARWDESGHPGLDYINWQDKIFRTGQFNNYQLSASGASDAVNYYVSANYSKNTGYIIGTEYSLFSARANIDIKLSDSFKVGFNLAPSYSVKDDPGVEGKDNILHKALSASPIFENTTNDLGELYTVKYAWGSSQTSMMNLLAKKGKNSMFRNLISSYASYKLTNDLTLKSTINFDNSDNATENYTPSNLLTGVQGAYYTYRRQNIVNENTLNYIKSYKDHDFNLLLGQSFSSYQMTRSYLTSGALYNSFSIETLPTGSTGYTNSEKNTLLSYFGRLQYDYKEKYLLSASIRRDGSSKFGFQQRWGVFPSLSLGWRVTQENFMKKVNWINDLKLRASAGINGSNNIGNYAAYSTLASYNYTLGGTNSPGQGNSAISNPLLHWEESKSTDLGLDFSILKNRISGTFEVYRKINSDLLLQVPIVGATGFTNYLTNVGKVQNQGWEFELNTSNIDTKAFKWKTSLNLSHNENKVLALGPDQTRIEISSGFNGVPFAKLEVGKPMYSLFMLVQDGVITQADIDAGGTTIGGNALKLGDPRYIDQNGDKKINENDRADVGNPTPKIIWGITNTFKYKAFDLNVLVQGQNGGTVYGLLGRGINRTGMSAGENSLDVDPRVRGNWRTTFTTFQANTDWLYSSDYLSIRNITLGYDLSKAFESMKRIDKARIYISGENWFYWNKYKVGYNPEAVNTAGSSDGRFTLPVDYGGAPLAKSLVLGLNINFN